MRSYLAFILICSLVSIEAFRLPGLGHFRNTNEYPTFEVGKLFSSFWNLMKPNPVNESENQRTIENSKLIKISKYNFHQEYFDFTVSIKHKEESNENDKEKSPKEEFRKMLPNPEVSVPYILAYYKFNKAIKELEELKNEVLNKDSNTEKSGSKNENAKEKLEKQNQFQKDESEDRYDDLSRFESWLFCW